MFLDEFVCLSVHGITQKVIDGFWWNFVGGGKWLYFGGDLDDSLDPGIF